jgi:hypothetical protein
MPSNYKSLQIGDKVSVRGGTSKNPSILTAGPFTILGRIDNPYLKNYWKVSFIRPTTGVVEYAEFPQHWLVPYIPGTRMGNRHNQPFIRNVTTKKARNIAISKVWESKTKTSGLPGEGPLNLVRNFANLSRPKENRHRKTRRSRR